MKFLHKWQNDEEVMRLARSQPDHVISMEGLEVEFDKDLKGEDTGRRVYVVEERASRKPIGFCGITLNRWARRMTSADVGLVIGEKDRWRKGYGTEVVRLLLREAFEQLNLHKVTWWTFAEHKASIALATKTGFKEEGRLREEAFFDNLFHDSVVLGLLRSEYTQRKKT